MTGKQSLAIFVLTSVILIFASTVHGQNESDPVLTPIGQEAFNILRQFFDYDPTYPLDVEVVDRQEKQGYVREKITFQGVDESPGSGYLAIPTTGEGPYPVIFLIHGLNSSKESWWYEEGVEFMLTDQLLKLGFSVLSLDAQYHGERAANLGLDSPGKLLDNEWYINFRDMQIESTIEYRRFIDYLSTRPEVNASQVGVVGYSMGGMMTFFLTAVDPRIKVSVAAVSPILTMPFLPTGIPNYAPYIDAPFLMLMATNDERYYTDVTAKQLLQLIGSKEKNLIIIESGHMLPAEWTTHAADWLRKYME